VVENNTGKLVVVVTENRFSTSLSSDSNEVDYDKDIVKKCKDTRTAFAAAGWSSDQVIFRLAAHRYLSRFQDETIKKLPPNAIICGPEQLLRSYSSTLGAFFASMSDVNQTK
jgi:uncharacterized protein YebE (UPF0316 family)